MYFSQHLCPKLVPRNLHLYVLAMEMMITMLKMSSFNHSIIIIILILISISIFNKCFFSIEAGDLDKRKQISPENRAVVVERSRASISRYSILLKVEGSNPAISRSFLNGK